jgi:lipopolysaccharide transport system ATP-binding protein
MSEPALRVEGLSKSYRIAQAQRHSHYRTLQEELLALPRRLWLAAQHNGWPSETFWALKEVCFEVKPGEVLGIIGRNGAGKSTLLKILSRITEPTAGQAEVNGRVGSLLEVGTGFHPELTGRENIYLSGAILGMSRREVKRRFDEIVAFADVERFLDTPAKHYSSGMYMRLAFAVAAHLESEILLVDEVLAVGDAEFQKRCLGKMGEMAHTGRTVLFVSHNLVAVTALCRRSIVLDSGHVAFDGATPDATAHYRTRVAPPTVAPARLLDASRSGTGKAVFTSIRTSTYSRSGVALRVAETGCDLRIEVTIQCRLPVANANVALIIYDANGYRLVDVNTALERRFLSLSAGCSATVNFRLYDVLLKPGLYYYGLWLGRGGVEEIDSIEAAAVLEVVETPEGAQHTEVFPGPYCCRFACGIDDA